MSAIQKVGQFLHMNWRHRELTKDLIKRDFKIRYLGSVLGRYWGFIHPLAMIAIYSIVFSRVAGDRLRDDAGSTFGFTVYLCAGLLPWNTFVEMISRGTKSFQENAEFIKKISFPKEVLQTVASGAALVSFGISLLLYVIFLAIIGELPSSSILLLPLVIVLQTLLASGLGMIFSIFNAFFRDMEQFLQILFQVWFWLTPIVYHRSFLPNIVQQLMVVNPASHFITLYQDIFFYRVFPSLETLGLASFYAILAYGLGAFMVSHFEDEVVDQL